jgi:2-oxoglutarate dehydrogenase complex dehydrogenase (E1) component-like enzyme
MPNPSFLEHLSPVACGFNRSMQHLISYTGEVDVENETATEEHNVLIALVILDILVTDVPGANQQSGL